MPAIRKVIVKHTPGRVLLIILVTFILMLVGAADQVAAKTIGKTAGTKVFPSPEAAVQALMEAVKNGDEKALLAIFGKEGKELIASGDAIADRKGRERFLQLYAAKHRLSRESDRMMALEVGEEQWPFPIPRVKEGEGWRFDTRIGKEEVLNRRIGRNEMSAIQTCLAYVDAQREYAARDRDGDGLLEYAQQLVSSKGRQDGLFWPAEEGREASPLGPLFAQAQEEGYRPRQGNAPPAPYHGYYYKMLKAQGKHAPGGARDYLVKGNLLGGFALVAYPARYGASGIMTFMVSHDGVVYQKNLGPGTPAAVRALQRFDPDKTWQKVK